MNNLVIWSFNLNFEKWMKVITLQKILKMTILLFILLWGPSTQQTQSNISYFSFWILCASIFVNQKVSWQATPKEGHACTCLVLVCTLVPFSVYTQRVWLVMTFFVVYLRSLFKRSKINNKKSSVSIIHIVWFDRIEISCFSDPYWLAVALLILGK